MIASQVMRSFTRGVSAQQPDAMLWGALESCPEGDDWKRALHALGAMRRMCRGGTDAIHQHTPAEIPRQLSLFSVPTRAIRKPAIAQ